MKNLIRPIRVYLVAAALAAAASCMPQSLTAQTNPPATPPPALTTALPALTPDLTAAPGSFFSTVAGYFTSFNPALETTFTKTNEFDVWAGADNVQGSGMTASLGLSYNLWNAVSVESITRNGSIAGTIVDQQLGIGYSKVVHDVKITGYALAGYDFPDKAAYGGIGVRFLKALTQNTFAGISLEEHIGGKAISNTPTVSILTGFNF